MNKLKYADDAQVLNACEDGIVGWEAAEQAELSNETPSAQALRLRGAIHLMIIDGLKLWEAEETYDALLAEQKESVNRTISTLEERAMRLNEEGKLSKSELEAFRADDKVAKFTVEALLGGADAKEAAGFAKLAKSITDAWQEGYDGPKPSTEKHDQLRRMTLRYQGMTDKEITLLFTIEKSASGETPTWLKARKKGMPIQLAKRFQDLVDRYSELTQEENFERKAYINLRSVLTRANSNLETRLAIKDFGIERIFEYILLKTADDLPYDKVENMLRGDIRNMLDDNNIELAQQFVDGIFTQHETTTDTKEDPVKALQQSLQNEPALRQFVQGYRDSMLMAIDRGRFR